MRIYMRGLGASVLIVLLVSATAADEEVPLEKLPKKVVAAVKAKFAGAELVSATKDSEEGKTYYEVAIKHKKEELEITLTPDGKIIEITKEIDPDDLPKVVVAALEKKYPKANLEEANEAIEAESNRKNYYVIIETAQEKLLEIKVDAKGKILKEKPKKKDDEQPGS